MRWTPRNRKPWRLWFAWRPIRRGRTWLWLEIVERRMQHGYPFNYWEYRPRRTK